MVTKARSGRWGHKGNHNPTPPPLMGVPGGRAGLTTGMPAPPEELADDALALTFWHRLGGYLHAQGWMAHEYVDALATASCVCADYVRTRQQFAKLNNQAFHTEKINGRVMIVEAPILRRLMQLAALRVKVLGEFGLTPLMASRVPQKRGGDGKNKFSPLASTGA